jgi:tRNA nucleotidyltransferase (CCA-adding enzyme)
MSEDLSEELLEKLRLLKQQLLPRAIPTEEEEKQLKLATNEFLNLLRESIKHPEIEIMLCGSAAKGTWIRGKKEFDVFVRFPKELKHRMFEILRKSLENAGLRFQEIPASRHYFRLQFQGFEVDVVPVLKISRPEEHEHVTDVTPFHVRYVASKLQTAPELRNEIRVLKYYLKLIGCYGAESHIAGLSGYACELLVLALGSFENVLLRMLTSQPPVYVDPEGVYGSLSKAKARLSREKLESPVILIDPVLPSRNAAASLSWETYAKMIFRTWESLGYCKSASKELPGVRLVFETKDLDLEEKFLAQLASLARTLVKKLEEYGFSVTDYAVNKLDKNKYSVEFRLIEATLEPLMLHLGPPLWNAEAVKRFINKYSNDKNLGYGFKDNRIFVVLRRKFRTAREYINYLLSSSELSKSKVLSEIRRWYVENL